MSVLCIDYGDSHLGLAYSPDGQIAYPLFAFETKEIREKVENVRKVRDKYGISQIVIGLPLDQEGNLSKQAKKAKKFGEELLKEVEPLLGFNLHKKIKVSYWNETLTSTEARQRMIEAKVPKRKRKELEHSFAAQIVLQEYLDANKSKFQNPNVKSSSIRQLADQNLKI